MAGTMENILVANQYGGRLVTCERHAAERRRFIVGDCTDSATTELCPACVQEQQAADLPDQLREALRSPKLAHTRARNHCGRMVCVYHRDDTSPTGVLLALMVPADMFEHVYAELRAAGQVPGWASPLSPTER